MSVIKMTTAQALIRFLDNQYISFDGNESKFVEGIFTIFGHGNVCGLGQALDEISHHIKVYQGRNEQGMALAATAFAKQCNRRKIIACTSSVGPGATNMVTAAALATVNNIPLLLLPGDTFSTRQPDSVLQQVEQQSGLSISTNDAFKPVCKYWDRISRPEQLMTALIQAMRVLTDPAETGAVCIALPQDVQGESYDYPDYFFKKRVHRITRRIPDNDELNDALQLILHSKKPLIICGGGVKYSEAGNTLEKFCQQFNIPFSETQAGKSACKSSNPYCLGGIGVTGNLAANIVAQEADLIISIGSRMTDFTTSSKTLFKNPNIKLLSINVSRFHAYKSDAVSLVADAKLSLEKLSDLLIQKNYCAIYVNEIRNAKDIWNNEMQRLANYQYDKYFSPLISSFKEGSIEEFAQMTGSTITQTSAISAIRENIDDSSIITGASGSLPGDLQKMWTSDTKNAYHMEYGYSCMGYEIASALGAKLANPEQECYAMVGDGSYLMLHSELITSLQEHKKINILLFDNCGFGCINNLQMSNGISSLATEFRYRDENSGLNGAMIPIDYAGCAAGYGAKTYRVRTIDELKQALSDAKKQSISTLIDIKVLPKTMTDGYNSWWHVGIASTSKNENIKDSYENKENNLKKARQY